MNYFLQYNGLLRAEGNDCIDFLNRMTTAGISGIQVGEHLRTVLLNDKGRIIDVLDVFRKPRGLFLKTSNCYEDKTLEYLSKYIVIDDVTLEKCDVRHVTIILSGDGLKEAVSMLSGEFEGKDDGEKDSELIVSYNDDLGFQSVNIICPLEDSLRIRNALGNRNLQTCMDYEAMRIRNARPEAPWEFNEDTNPLECGLKKYVSFAKGCYVGQEVIARLDSQNKVPKVMVKIESDENLVPGMKISRNDEIECGFISSALTADGKAIALGFIRSVELDFNAEYHASSENVKAHINIKQIT
ncbi:MAG: hypothetical protein K1X85_01610 [Ignavibacteria bacterium]|nr:hypothetical protein [Ignavibacteria bacterium]